VSQAEVWIAGLLEDLTLEEKIGQLFAVAIDAGSAMDGHEELEGALGLVKEFGVGSFVLYGGSPVGVVTVLNRLQQESRLPLLIAADFEGGAGQAVKGATEFPANMAFGAAGSPELMYEAASVYATEGAALGIHLTYAPVVDISLRPASPAESVRSFGHDLGQLERLVSAHVRGFHDHGMLTTAKHFPGRGDVVPVPGRPGWLMIDKSAAEIEQLEFAAFRSAIKAGVAFVMTEHLAVPSLTNGTDEPASVEPTLVNRWLKEHLGFGGVVTSDDLWYDHVVDRYGSEEVVVKCFEAGHDVLLKPRDAASAIRYLVEAVKSGRVETSRIDESLSKVLGTKARLGLNRYERRFTDPERAREVVGNARHRELAQRVADLSLTTLVEPPAGSWTSKSIGDRARIVNLNVYKSHGDPSPPILTGRLHANFPGLTSFDLGPRATQHDREEVRRAARQGDLIIVSLFLQREKYGDPAPLRDVDRELIAWLTAHCPGRVMAMSYGNPHLLHRLPPVSGLWVGYGERGWFGNQEVYFDSFIKLLKGDLKPQGRLPVQVDPPAV